MKRLSLLAMGLMTLTAPAALAESDATLPPSGRVEKLAPTIVDADVNEVFMPRGFDDNDNIEIVLDGHFRNTCYRVGPSRVSIDEVKKVIRLRQQAYYYPGSWCAPVRVTYMAPVRLGLLAAGDYQVIIEHDGESFVAKDMLPVGIATSSSPDEFLYAPVNESRIVWGSSSNKPVPVQPVPVKFLGDLLPNSQDGDASIFLKGTFEDGCMSFDHVKVIIHLKERVIEVLPIAKIEENREACSAEAKDFEVGVSLPAIPTGKYLIHTRSLNGQSLNQLVTF